jgi:hypothetical protein
VVAAQRCVLCCVCGSSSALRIILLFFQRLRRVCRRHAADVHVQCRPCPAGGGRRAAAGAMLAPRCLDAAGGCRGRTHDAVSGRVPRSRATRRSRLRLPGSHPRLVGPGRAMQEARGLATARLSSVCCARHHLNCCAPARRCWSLASYRRGGKYCLYTVLPCRRDYMSTWQYSRLQGLRLRVRVRA